MFTFKNFTVKQVGSPKEIVTQAATPAKEPEYNFQFPKDNPFGAVPKATKPGVPAQSKEAHFQYIVEIEHTETLMTYQFEFNDSIHNWMNGVNELDEDGLKSAFYCILSDALAGAQNADAIDFIEEFGYEDLKEGRRIYNACKKVADEVAEKFDLTESELCDLLNDFQEEFDY